MRSLSEDRLTLFQDLKKKTLEEFEQKNIFITFLSQSSFKLVDLVQ